jgi:NADPH:quinone reductase-like Zn-dependent oxidoreductase
MSAMQAWEIERGAGIASLRRIERALPVPGGGEVRVRLRAVALNARDLNVAAVGSGRVVPASDAAGVVEAIGEGVTRWRVGDRVAPAFYPRWIDGCHNGSDRRQSRWRRRWRPRRASARARRRPVRDCPAHLDDVEGATLPCAALTAWHALFVAQAPQPATRCCCSGPAACPCGR